MSYWGDDKFCLLCGGDVQHWNQGIYECMDCGAMIPDDDEDDE